MPWNIGSHRRKFLIAPGTAHFGDSGREETEIAFWGEWEPPSHVLKRWPRSGELPTVLHQPCVDAPPEGARQNTDPWVFGRAFLYSNCKQLNPRPSRSASALQRLASGSIILFGSSVGGEFVLDTVFVVGDVVGTYTPLGGDLDVDPVFEQCTMESLTTGDDATSTFTRYRGATPAEAVDGMFSFVPCTRAADSPGRFARPPIALPGVINPKSRQAPSGATASRSLADRMAAWHAVTNQVLAAGLALGTDIETPSPC